MAEHDELIGILNEAISLEYTATVTYNQNSMLLTGRDKVLFEDILKHHAQESLGHAKMWGDRIVYLGGVPKGVVNNIRQSTDVMEILQIGLDLETKAVEIYSRAHKACKHEPTKYMLENHILDEDKDVEEFKKLLGKVQIAAGSESDKRGSKSKAA